MCFLVKQCRDVLTLCRMYAENNMLSIYVCYEMGSNVCFRVASTCSKYVPRS